MKKLREYIRVFNNAFVRILMYVVYYLGFFIPATLRFLTSLGKKHGDTYWQKPPKSTKKTSAY